MKNNLLGKKLLSCSFCLYRFRKYVSCGLPIINFCNPGVHYETPCIYISPFATADFKHLYNFPFTSKPVVFSFMNLQSLIFANIKIVTSCNATCTHVYMPSLPIRCRNRRSLPQYKQTAVYADVNKTSTDIN